MYMINASDFFFVKSSISIHNDTKRMSSEYLTRLSKNEYLIKSSFTSSLYSIILWTIVTSQLIFKCHTSFLAQYCFDEEAFQRRKIITERDSSKLKSCSNHLVLFILREYISICCLQNLVYETRLSDSCLFLLPLLPLSSSLICSSKRK